MWGRKLKWVHDERWVSKGYGDGGDWVEREWQMKCQWSLDILDAWPPMGPKGKIRDEVGMIHTKFLRWFGFGMEEEGLDGCSGESMYFFFQFGNECCFQLGEEEGMRRRWRQG